jgi:hypothetical protein
MHGRDPGPNGASTVPNQERTISAQLQGLAQICFCFRAEEYTEWGLVSITKFPDEASILFAS